MVDPGSGRSERRAAQAALERRLVLGGRCPADIVTGLRARLFQFRPGLAGEASATRRSFDPDFQDEIGCVFDAAVYTGEEDSSGGPLDPLTRERVRHWFTGLKRIGAESVEGYAFIGGFGPDRGAGSKGERNLYVIKGPRDADRDTLAHEAAVGFLATNQLRRYVPTFMYVYSAFACSPPILADRGGSPGEARSADKEPITWCSGGKENVTYIVTENIANAVSFAKFVETCPPADFLNVYLQVLSALNLAWHMAGYTHHDLHSGNVLVRRLRGEVAINFYGPGGPGATAGYIRSRAVATIIDYGYSRFVYDGASFGVYGLEGANVNPSEGFPLYDAYKLLCFLGESAASRNAPALPAIDAVFRYFGEGDIRDRVARRLGDRRDYYTLDAKWRPQDFDGLLRWISAQFDLSGVVTSHSGGLLVAAYADGMPIAEFSERFIDKTRTPTDLFEYCDAIGAVEALDMPAADRDALVAWMGREFDVVAAFSAGYGENFAAAAEARASIIDAPPVLPAKDLAIFLTPARMSQYMRRGRELGLAKDHLERASGWARSARCALSRNKSLTPDRARAIDEIESVISDAYRTYDSDVQNIRANENILRAYRGPRTPEITQFEMDHSALSAAL